MVRRPKRTQGSWLHQSEVEHLAVSDAFNVLCHLSTIPFAWGWYDVVCCRFTPSSWASDDQTSDVKTEPRSDVMCSGRPNLLIQASSRADAHDKVVASSFGIASSHLVDLSMIVNRYRLPSELGSGPTISTWMCPNRRVGCWKLPRDALVCLCTLLRWQLTHVRVQVVMSNKLLCHQLYCGTDGRVGQGMYHLKNVSSEGFWYKWPRSSGANVTK